MFAAQLAGSLHEGQSADGTAVVDLQLRLTGRPDGVLRIRLAGQQDAGGGVLMSRSAVTLGPASAPGRGARTASAPTSTSPRRGG